MAELYQERFEELPFFRRIKEQLAYCTINGLSLEETAVRMMICLEHPLTWDTTCGNCAVLMDKLYEAECRIQGSE